MKPSSLQNNNPISSSSSSSNENNNNNNNNRFEILQLSQNSNQQSPLNNVVFRDMEQYQLYQQQQRGNVEVGGGSSGVLAAQGLRNYSSSVALPGSGGDAIAVHQQEGNEQYQQQYQQQYSNAVVGVVGGGVLAAGLNHHNSNVVVPPGGLGDAIAVHQQGGNEQYQQVYQPHQQQLRNVEVGSGSVGGGVVLAQGLSNHNSNVGHPGQGQGGDTIAVHQQGVHTNNTMNIISGAGVWNSVAPTPTSTTATGSSSYLLNHNRGNNIPSSNNGENNNTNISIPTLPQSSTPAWNTSSSIASGGNPFMQQQQQQQPQQQQQQQQQQQRSGLTADGFSKHAKRMIAEQQAAALATRQQQHHPQNATIAPTIPKASTPTVTTASNRNMSTTKEGGGSNTNSQSKNWSVPNPLIQPGQKPQRANTARAIHITSTAKAMLTKIVVAAVHSAGMVRDEDLIRLEGMGVPREIVIRTVTAARIRRDRVLHQQQQQVVGGGLKKVVQIAAPQSISNTVTNTVNPSRAMLQHQGCNAPQSISTAAVATVNPSRAMLQHQGCNVVGPPSASALTKIRSIQYAKTNHAISLPQSQQLQQQMQLPKQQLAVAAPKPSPPPAKAQPPKSIIAPVLAPSRVIRGLFLSTNTGKLVPYGKNSSMQSHSQSSTIPFTTDNIHEQAKLIQLSLLKQQTTKLTTPLSSHPQINIRLHPLDEFKRMKIQPRKEIKNLDKQFRKFHSHSIDALMKGHKLFLKSMINHRNDFLKYHKGRKNDRRNVCRTIRDHFDRLNKKKERLERNEEKERLANLKELDEEKYKELMEEAKRERVEFLMNKTEEYIEQISTLLSTKRLTEESTTIKDDAGNNSSSQLENKKQYYSSAHVQTEEVHQPSTIVGGILKEYQISGLAWLVSLYNNKLNGILADDMGLGKTIQTIALLSYLSEYKSNPGPYLVIVPLSTLSNWYHEFAKWCPSLQVVLYKGTPIQRKTTYKEKIQTGLFNVVLTTYEYVMKDKSLLKKLTWQYAVVDEGHRMKNNQSKFAIILSKEYKTRHRLLLTGTPLQNNLPELWSLLNFLLPEIFHSLETFEEWFLKPFSQYSSVVVKTSSNNESDEVTEEVLSNQERMLIIQRLHELLRPFMLRRVKSEVLDQLPEKKEVILKCELSSWQKILYSQISSTNLENRRGLNNVIMQLRKVCNHPYLFHPGYYPINDEMIQCSGKLELLDRLLPKLKAGGHRILLFSQMTTVMTILEDYLNYKQYIYLRLDGSTSAEDREKRMYKFNAPSSPYFMFLLSTRAGGLGLNLASADTVILFDSDWNPMMDLQAQDRAHRIGQKNEVRVFRFITNTPLEERILSVAMEKLNMKDIVVEAGKFDNKSTLMNEEEKQKMMEVLIKDFTVKDPEEEENATTVLDSEEDEEEEELNEMISSTDLDFEMYTKMDAMHNNTAASTTLFTDMDDVPDWIKHPKKKKKNLFSMDLPLQENEESVASSTTTTTVTTTANNTTTNSDSQQQPKKKKSTVVDSIQLETTDTTTSSVIPRRKTKKPHTWELPETSTSSNSSIIIIPKKTRGHASNKATTVDSSTATPSNKSSHKEQTPTRVSRQRNKTVSYNDNMSESQFIKMVEKSAAEAEGDDITTPSKKQPKNKPPPSKSTNKKKKIMLSPLSQTLRNITKKISSYTEPKTNRLLSEMFLEKPCEQTYPDYYVIIPNPIAINDITKKCKGSKYITVDEYIADWSLLFQNSKCYNEEGSWIVQDGITLENEINRLLNYHGLLDDDNNVTTTNTTSNKKRSRDNNKDEGEQPSSKKKKSKRNNSRSSSSSKHSKSKRV